MRDSSISQKGYFSFLSFILRKAAKTPILTTAVIPIEGTIFPVVLHRNQNTPLMNAPAMQPRKNLIDAYYHLLQR